MAIILNAGSNPRLMSLTCMYVLVPDSFIHDSLHITINSRANLIWSIIHWDKVEPMIMSLYLCIISYYVFMYKYSVDVLCLFFSLFKLCKSIIVIPLVITNYIVNKKSQFRIIKRSESTSPGPFCIQFISFCWKIEEEEGEEFVELSIQR